MSGRQSPGSCRTIDHASELAMLRTPRVLRWYYDSIRGSCFRGSSHLAHTHGRKSVWCGHNQSCATNADWKSKNNNEDCLTHSLDRRNPKCGTDTNHPRVPVLNSVQPISQDQWCTSIQNPKHWIQKSQPWYSILNTRDWIVHLATRTVGTRNPFFVVGLGASKWAGTVC